MKRVFEINKISKDNNSFELKEIIKTNIIRRKNITILHEIFLPNIFNYLTEENEKEKFKNEYVIIITNNGKLISSIYKPKNSSIEEIQLKTYREIFPEILNDPYPNNIIYDNLKNYCKSENYREFNNPVLIISNYWYIEEYNVGNYKSYKLFSINNYDSRKYIGKSDKLDILINNYIRENHKHFNLGPNAFVVINKWNNEPKLIKLPLRFNTNSLLKILNNQKENSENLESNQELKECIVPYIDLQNHIIYIVSTHNKIGMTNIENILKENMLVICTPIKYNISKDGWTLNLLRKIQESIDLELSGKKEDFKIELMF